MLNIDKNLTKNIWSLTFVNERRWDVHFNQGLTIRLPSKNVEYAWEKVVFLNENFNILDLGLTDPRLKYTLLFLTLNAQSNLHDYHQGK